MTVPDYPPNPVDAFWKAVRTSDCEAIQRFYDCEPKIFEAYWKAGENIVCEAARKSSPEAIRLILSLGGDANEQDSNGWTPLCWAVARGRVHAAKLLLEAGADPNLHCPLLKVVSEHNSEPVAMAELLLDHGANVNEPFMSEGLPPRNILSRAMELKRTDLVEFLKSRGAQLPGDLPGPSAATNEVAPTAMGDYTEDILAHFRKHYGRPEERAVREIVRSSEYPVAIHYIRPSWRRGLGMLFTVGLSRFEMPVPRGAERYRLAELMVAVPKSWPEPDEAIKMPEYAWPIQWLRKIAAYPHANRTWLGGTWTTLANGDPPEPLGPGTTFTAWVMASPGTKKNVVKCSDGAAIQLYQLFPLYTEEYLLERREGVNALMTRFEKTGLPEYIDINRRNAALD